MEKLKFDVILLETNEVIFEGDADEISVFMKKNNFKIEELYFLLKK